MIETSDFIVVALKKGKLNRDTLADCHYWPYQLIYPIPTSFGGDQNLIDIIFDILFTCIAW